QEGRIDEGEKEEIEKRIKSAVSSDEIREWFRPGLKIVTEADILTTKGTIRRPDRVIISDDRAIVVDFKFGRERSEYKEQVALYRNLLLEMGYKQVDAYLWYVDQGKVVCVN
ncbi:MAG TPA: ATP-dependent helicase, partial [Bacteroidales bacterium]|nr:ATP-dependent helicase [Bacteroidales bacterium]